MTNPRMHTKPEWALITEDGEIVEIFLRKHTARNMKYQYEKQRFGKLYIIPLEEAKKMKSHKPNEQREVFFR